MADWDDVRRIALALPETDEHISREHRTWRVKEKLFVWERPLRKTDLEALGDSASSGPILGLRTEHLEAKEAILADTSGVFFTTPHFNGYPAVLVRIPSLRRLKRAELRDLVVGAWLARAQKRVAKAWLAENEPDAL